MRVPLSWLREYVEFDLSPAELAERLTMAGISVEAVEDLALPYQGIVVGKVLEIKPHPSSGKLLLAVTDWGLGRRTLVTAARNLKPGDLVPVAPEGCRLPGGQAIGAAVFAGIVSEGMLCSAAELGLEKQSDGIMVLEGDWEPGTPIAKAIGADETVFVLELTPNRADCLGLLGVAREVAAITGGALHPPSTAPKEEGPPIGGLAAVQVHDADLCPRYGGRVLVDVRIAPSPAWMQHRLRAAGVRPVNNLVDITNYVMLELNQPLHAFDLDRLAERQLIIRRARESETMTTLDGNDRVLAPGMLVIADPEGSVAVAGVMGGASSEVTERTSRIFLEGAFFERTGIRRTARALGMRTEASIRFERGIDPAAIPDALGRAAFLAEQIGAGRTAAGMIDVASGRWEPRTIMMAPARINALLGTDFTAGEISDLLQRLSFDVTKESSGAFAVTVPTYRLDVEGPADLAEEVARLHGYDRIPSTYPAATQVGRRTPAQEFAVKARRLLQNLGQTEVMTYSFCSPRLFDQLRFPVDDPARGALRILAPLSEEWSVMRPTLLGGILDTLAVNARRGTADAAIYEMARVFRPEPGQELPRQPMFLAGGLMGAAAPRNWTGKPRPVDFYDLKGLVESLLEGLGIGETALAEAAHPALHPGRSACLRRADGTLLGFLGEAHPQVSASYDLRGPVLLYEFDFDLLSGSAARELKTRPLPRFPAILRDLALVVMEEISYAELERAIRELAGPYLAGLELFDIYTGAQVSAGRKSMAFSLAFRAEDRTLTDAEVNAYVEAIVTGMRERYGAALR